MKSEGNKGAVGRRSRILIAPLDWGLGHATRCIPLIRLLLHFGNEVVIAASGKTALLLQKEFPGIRILPLPGYDITYSQNPRLLAWKLLFQIPKIRRIFKEEQAMLKKWVEEEKIDAVISDNRPGMFHQEIPSVYIAHQLHVETGIKWMNFFVDRIHRRMINSFNECWVPDMKEKNGWAGNLSHPKILPAVPVHYLGILSRFEKTATPLTYDLLIMLSGPEPQRSLLEKKMLTQAAGLRMRIAMLRGLPDHESVPVHPEHIRIFNHLPSEALNQLICSSALIVARGGYSTIMDLVALRKPALLIPTPGQAEQEYLAAYLKSSNIFTSVKQENVELGRDLKKIKGSYSPPSLNATQRTLIINNWLKQNGLTHE